MLAKWCYFAKKSDLGGYMGLTIIQFWIIKPKYNKFYADNSSLGSIQTIKPEWDMRESSGCQAF